ESRASTNTIRPAISRMAPPTPPRSAAQIRSPSRPRPIRTTGGGAAIAGATVLSGSSEDGLSINCQCLEGALHLLDHGGRQGRIVQRRSRLLALVDGPPEKLHQRLTLGRLLLVLVDEDVR